DDPSSFEAMNFLQSRARMLLPRVQLHLDDDVDRAYPQRMGGRVEVQLCDGRLLTAVVDGLTTQLSSTERQWVVEEKFKRTTRSAYSEDRQNAILREVFSET